MELLILGLVLIGAVATVDIGHNKKKQTQKKLKI